MVLKNRRPGVRRAALAETYVGHVAKSDAPPGCSLGLGQGQDIPMVRPGIDPGPWRGRANVSF